MFKIIVASAACLSLAGCATCGKHPVMCGVGAALLIGGAAAVATNSDSSSNAGRQGHLLKVTSPCQPQGVTPCH